MPASLNQARVPRSRERVQAPYPHGPKRSHGRTTDPELHKTEMCKNIVDTGYCKHGSRCVFAHSPWELRARSRHPLYKTVPCKDYWAGWPCHHHCRCHFVHGSAADAQAVQWTLVQLWQQLGSLPTHAPPDEDQMLDAIATRSYLADPAERLC
ncbi:hypothetical protein H4R35_003819 [Dimargaris xerosporica]|nr:hypothetical protein H4R35_003819 [Dimargaris xerosporica]